MHHCWVIEITQTKAKIYDIVWTGTPCGFSESTVAIPKQSSSSSVHLPLKSQKKYWDPAIYSNNFNFVRGTLSLIYKFYYFLRGSPSEIKKRHG